MSSKLQNSIWLNINGNLGNVKVQIPDGVTTLWPEGDALVHNFVFNKGKLVGFIDTKALIVNDSKTTTFPYEYVNISLPSIAEGEMTYNYNQCAYFILNDEVLKGDVPSDEELEIITKKYAGCKTVDDIKAVDPDYLTNDIVDGVWTEGLGDLEQGGNRFYDGGMFASCSKLTSFSSDLSNLTNGDYMFYNCNNLTSFSSDLSNLTNGRFMFYNCTNLKSFSSDLSSFINGDAIFAECKLDTASVQNIADTIGNYPGQGGSGIIQIGIGNSEPNEQETAAFNKMVSKGWVVYANGYTFGSSSSCCGTCCASLTTLDETDGEFVAPKPYWAKPVQSDEQNARYVDSEGNFYNILGAQFIYGDSLDTYGMFTCEDDAAAQMRLKKIGEEEIETA